MPPGDAGYDRAGEVIIQVRVHGSGDVLMPIVESAAFGIGQHEATINDSPVGIGHMQPKLGRGD